MENELKELRMITLFSVFCLNKMENENENDNGRFSFCLSTIQMITLYKKMEKKKV